MIIVVVVGGGDFSIIVGVVLGVVVVVIFAAAIFAIIVIIIIIFSKITIYINNTTVSKSKHTRDAHNECLKLRLWFIPLLTMVSNVTVS